ncbi:unnamed protein product, partial [Rotaria sp. Silwood1]
MYSKDDHDRFCKRVVSSDNDVKSLTESPWNLAPMLYNQLSTVVVANDRVRNHDIDNIDFRRFLLSLPDNKTEGLLGYLP